VQAPELLDFRLPDFTRISWTTERAREVWEPRIRRITESWLEIEWRAVAAGLRSCAVRPLSSAQLVSEAARWAEAGLSSLPLALEGISPSGYSAVAEPVSPDRPFRIRTVVGSLPDLVAFKRAWDDLDQETIGSLLGYPPCCREFFHEVWVERGMVDPTWPMAAADLRDEPHARAIELEGPPQANILWRWMGVRAVPHLPCSCNCAPTIELADGMLELGRESGFSEEVGWITEILSWPLEWSALHGIAEVRTPVLKVSTMTDSTPHKYVVRWLGSGFPLEGARGLQFPYRGTRRALSGSRAFARGLAAATPTE
jgi:hypothetical protein